MKRYIRSLLTLHTSVRSTRRHIVVQLPNFHILSHNITRPLHTRQCFESSLMAAAAAVPVKSASALWRHAGSSHLTSLRLTRWCDCYHNRIIRTDVTQGCNELITVIRRIQLACRLLHFTGRTYSIYQLAEMADKVIDSLVSRIFEVWN